LTKGKWSDAKTSSITITSVVVGDSGTIEEARKTGTIPDVIDSAVACYIVRLRGSNVGVDNTVAVKIAKRGGCVITVLSNARAVSSTYIVNSRAVHNKRAVQVTSGT
jgi:hypothetical protein